MCILILLYRAESPFATDALLWLLTLMICSLISINLGIFDLMLLEYPLVLAYAAMYSGQAFLLVAVWFYFAVLFCSGFSYFVWLD